MEIRDFETILNEAYVKDIVEKNNGGAKNSKLGKEDNQAVFSAFYEGK